MAGRSVVSPSSGGWTATLLAAAVSSFVCSRFIPGAPQVAGRERPGNHLPFPSLPSTTNNLPSATPYLWEGEERREERRRLDLVWGPAGWSDLVPDWRQRKTARWLQLVVSAQSRKSDNNNRNYDLHN